MEIEKMWHFKTTAVSVIVGALSRIKKRRDKHINKLSGSASQENSINMITPKRGSKQ